MALACLGLGLLLLGRSPVETLRPMFVGAFGSRFGWSETLLRAVPVLFCALAASLPAESGQVNIGGEGQLQLGAIGTAAAAAALAGHSPSLVTAAMVTAAMVMGAAWAVVPAGLKVGLRVNEALVALFLNYVAIHLTQYLVHGPMRDPASLGWPMGPMLSEGVLLRPLCGTRLHMGVFVAAGLALVVQAVVWGTRGGAELPAVGHNPQASRPGGHSSARGTSSRLWRAAARELEWPATTRSPPSNTGFGSTPRSAWGMRGSLSPGCVAAGRLC